LKAPEIVSQPIIGGSELRSKGPWPECVGKTGEECVKLIKGFADDLSQVTIVPNGSMVTMDYRTDRVRVFVDEAGIVSQIPSRG
jgi:hypothetical protein